MGKITKRDLVSMVAEKTGLTQLDTKIVLDCFLETVTNELQDGHNIEIRGFGRLKVKQKPARKARNPRTNEEIRVDAGFKAKYDASRELIKRVNDAAIERGDVPGGIS